MQRHQRKFNEIKNLLKEKLGEKIDVISENGNEIIEIKNSNFWLMVDKTEFTVGFGLNHTHFSDEYGNLDDGIFQTLDLLTNRIKTTNFIKGNTIFKTTVEIEYDNSKPLNIGTTNLLIYPFWKKTKIETIVSEEIIKKKEIEKEANLILNEN
ncbi:hypothetical protein [Chryseobacterium sp. 5_R23647]|uniref:hypothetical protein n=1 Tax=Chryseobacterium sp. 5_R23647 TaxID=2258964 RepID=UPI000E21E1CC|nr:hypothetical protein [Chryseobacterium sp. 5_R23647]REC42603.1 hypothetical protein DRF69_11145 [Chryseobacterium sp. 5_R23647]